jgi:23S rRNA (adenine2503-C2)-methyltransferase
MRESLPIIVGSPERRSFLETPREAFQDWLNARGEAPIRWKQIRRQILMNRRDRFDAMTDLPLALRDELAGVFDPLAATVDRHLVSSDETHKLVLRLRDGRTIESVLIQESPRRTACISTQVGCAMGCVFCASGLEGVERNLTSGEILEQLIRLRNLTPANDRLSHVVVMGMGEPLANLDNLLEALEVACSPEGLGIGARHVTISTVGLPAKIRKLAESGKQYHLAVSLHAPNDALRSTIVPTNDKTGIPEILAACDDFVAKTGRQVTYEYILLGGMNDGPREARELVDLLRGRIAHVNLIPWNTVEGLPFQRPEEDTKQRFIETLRRSGVSVKVRKRKGADIDAACGQLRRRAARENALASEAAPA